MSLRMDQIRREPDGKKRRLLSALRAPLDLIKEIRYPRYFLERGPQERGAAEVPHMQHVRDGEGPSARFRSRVPADQPMEKGLNTGERPVNDSTV